MTALASSNSQFRNPTLLQSGTSIEHSSNMSDDGSAAAAATPPSVSAAATAASPDLQLENIEYCDAGRGIRLAYESFGDSAAPVLLLIQGLSAPMLGWPDRFCARLAERSGLRVVRFDNRDIGLSTILHDQRVDVMAAMMSRDFSSAPYLLADMADDTAALLRHLAASGHSAPAHVMGASMGGMISQELVLRHPTLVASLISLFSTPAPKIGQPTPKAAAVLFAPPPRGRAETQQRAVDVYKIIGSEPAYPLDEEWHRAAAGLSFDRSADVAGSGRQLLALNASPARTERLAAVRCPTLVIHGDADPLIQLAGGEATAAAIPGAELFVLKGMGHNLPEPLWDTIVDRITTFTQRASAAGSASATSATAAGSASATAVASNPNASAASAKL